MPDPVRPGRMNTCQLVKPINKKICDKHLHCGARPYKYNIKCLYGENSKTGSVKVPQKFLGRSAAVKVTFTPKKYFYGAPKNGTRAPYK